MTGWYKILIEILGSKLFCKGLLEIFLNMTKRNRYKKASHSNFYQLFFVIECVFSSPEDSFELKSSLSTF